MNILLCIGCNRYAHLPALISAEADAKAVFDLLTANSSAYPLAFSRLLLSPTAPEITKALGEVSSRIGDVDVLTFFFAGHGAVKSGSFYLCTSESDMNRLSMSAYPIVSLFQMVNEFKPTQVNVIIDACQAGGSSFDLSTLVKPETIGLSTSSSIAFLGACAANERAGETNNGGILTTELVKCLNGHHQIQSDSPSLDLMEVAAFVSTEIQKTRPRQKPVSWGLSLFGQGWIADNPCFSGTNEEKRFHIHSVLPGSDLGQKIQSLSSEIWDEYRSIKKDPNPRRLLDLIGKLHLEGAGMTANATVVQGLASTFSVRAGESSELMARSQCLAVAAVSLLKYIDATAAQSSASLLLGQMIENDRLVLSNLLQEMDDDPVLLTNGSSPAADVFYLPLRITKLLGWAASIVLIERLIHGAAPSQRNAFLLARKLLNQYRGSFVAVSEEQATSLYVFLKACISANEHDLAREIAQLYYASFAERGGNLARPDTDGEQALNFIFFLSKSEKFENKDWRPANPSTFLPPLLVNASKLGIAEELDLQAFDRKHVSYFLPTDYRDFGSKVVEHGQNIGHRIGFGIWHVSEYQDQFDQSIKAHLATPGSVFPPIGVALTVCASLLFPDRIPFILER